MMKRALIITPSIPQFPSSGTPMRDYCLAREMAKRYQVTFLLPYYGDDSRAKTEPLQEFCRVRYFDLGSGQPWSLTRRIGYSINRRLPLEQGWQLIGGEPAMVRALKPLYGPLRGALATIDWEEFDLLQIVHSHLAPAIGASKVPVPTIVDWHNVYSVLEARHAGNVNGAASRLVARRELRRVRRSERQVAQEVSLSVAVSDKDADAIKALYSAARVCVVPNGVDSEYFSNPAPQKFSHARLVFTGTMDYLPNEEGVLYFCEEVLPEILRARPDAQFYVVGQRPSAAIMGLEARYPDKVRVTGFVEDVRPYVRKAAVSVAPLLNGGGTRLKILEAMAMRKPVVSTSIGAEGLELENGREIVIANEPRAFARAVVSLLADRDKAARLAEAGHRAALERYEWKPAAEKLAEAWERVTA